MKYLALLAALGGPVAAQAQSGIPAPKWHLEAQLSYQPFNGLSYEAVNSASIPALFGPQLSLSRQLCPRLAVQLGLAVAHRGRHEVQGMGGAPIPEIWWRTELAVNTVTLPLLLRYRLSPNADARFGVDVLAGVTAVRQQATIWEQPMNAISVPHVAEGPTMVSTAATRDLPLTFGLAGVYRLAPRWALLAELRSTVSYYGAAHAGPGADSRRVRPDAGNPAIGGGVGVRFGF